MRRACLIWINNSYIHMYGEKSSCPCFRLRYIYYANERALYKKSKSLHSTYIQRVK